MTVTITYTDPSESMTLPNNPTSYDYSKDGVITLVAPSINCGEFRGWYLDSAFTNRITTLDSTINSNITIYAWVNINTQLQILGSSITEVGSIDGLNGKYILLTNSISSSDSRSLSAIAPSEFSKLVTYANQYIYAVSDTISANLDTVNQEYYIDVNEQESLEINVLNYINSNHIIFHFTRGTNCTLNNISFTVTVVGPTIRGSSTNSYEVSVGSTLILNKSNNAWYDSIFYNPQLTEIASELVDNSLYIRNYAYKGVVTLSPSNSNEYGGRKYIDLTLSDLDLSQSESDVIYKSISIQFDSSSYDASGADINLLNKKQGYLNLIDVEASKLTYDASTQSSSLRLTYDYVPSYLSTSLSSITQDIPIRIMVVI